MPRDASELAHRLAREAEAVCRHYLSNGKREGRYWLVGDVHNTPGRSMFVRLQELAERARRQVDRRRDRRARRSARHHQRKPWASRFPRGRGGSAAISEACLASEPQLVLKLAASASTGWIARGRKTALCNVRPIEGTVVEAYLQRRGMLTCTMVAACASIRAATIDLTSTFRPRPGRR